MELAVCTLKKVLFLQVPTTTPGCVMTLLLDCARAIDFLYADSAVPHAGHDAASADMPTTHVLAVVLS